MGSPEQIVGTKVSSRVPVGSPEKTVYTKPVSIGRIVGKNPSEVLVGSAEEIIGRAVGKIAVQV